MVRKDHFAVTLALHNVSSLEGGPKRPKDKSKDNTSPKGKEKEKQRSKWRPSISASVNDFAERSSILISSSVVPSIAVEEASIMTTGSGDGRRYSSSTASMITARTMSTISAGAGGLLTPVQSSASSSSGSSGASTSSSGSSEGRALLRKELEEYFEGGADMSSKAWADFVNAPAKDSSKVGTSTPSARRPSTSLALPSPVPSLSSASNSRVKIPPMPKMPPPPPPPTAPLPSPPLTAPPSTFRTSFSPASSSHPNNPSSTNPIPIPKRPATSPATGLRSGRQTYQHSYPSSPEDILMSSHRLARVSKSPPRRRPQSRPTSPPPPPRSPISPGPPPDAVLPALPDMKMKTRTNSASSSGSAYSNESSELAYLVGTGPSFSASTLAPAQSHITTTSAGTGTGASAYASSLEPTGRSSLNPTSSPAVIKDADVVESNLNTHAFALLPAPTSSLLLTGAISPVPPSSEMNASGRKVDEDQKGKAVNKKPSPALLALWERQNREMGGSGSGRGQGRTNMGYAAHAQHTQQPQQQRPAPIYTSVLRESPKSMDVTLSTSPPRISPHSPPTTSRLLAPNANQGRPAQLNPSSSRGPRVSPRAFTPTPLPAQADEETASMLSLERRGELINIDVEGDSPLEDSDLEGDGGGYGRGHPVKRLSALSIMSNESEDPRLSGLISSFPITPTSTSTFMATAAVAGPQVVPFLSRPVRRGAGVRLRSGSDSGDADDEGWDSDVDPQILGLRTLRGYGRM